MSKLGMMTIVVLAALLVGPSTAGAQGAPKGDRGGAARDTGYREADTLPERDDPSRKEMDSGDTEFVRKMSSGSVAEMELGELAQDRASSQEVKDFAKMMVEEHRKAYDELKQVARLSSSSISNEMDAEHEALEDRLSGLKGAEFDRAYMEAMVEDHEKTADDLKRHAGSTVDADLKAWVQRTLPTVQEHLSRARAILDRLRGGRPGATTGGTGR